MSSMMSCGGRPSTVQPMFCAVPKISLAVPLNSRAIERGRNVRAMLIMSSNETLPLCFTVEKKEIEISIRDIGCGFGSHALKWFVPKFEWMVFSPFFLSIHSMEMTTIIVQRIVPFNLPFLTFFRSRGGSFNALMMSEAADGTTEMLAWRFWMVKHTVILRPFQSPVALAMSSPIFFGDCKIKCTRLVWFG